MKNKKYVKLIVGVILVFFSGLLIGAGATFYIINNKEQKVDPLDKFRADIFKLMVKDLKLTSQQQVEVGALLDKGIERMKKFRLKHAPEILMIIKENHEGIQKILTPEQWEKYQGYRRYKLDSMQKNIPKL